jgi:hypothetical protein
MSRSTTAALTAAAAGVTAATLAGTGVLPRSWPVIGGSALAAGVGFAYMAGPR